MTSKPEIALYDSLMTMDNYNDLKDWWTIGYKYAHEEDGEGPRKLKWLHSGGIQSPVKRPDESDLPDTEISVFTDKDLISPIVDLVKSKHKIAWIHECKSVHPWAYELIMKVEDKFDYIFTFDKDLLERSEKYLHGVRPAGCAFKKEHVKIHPKTKFMSLVASKKGKEVVISRKAQGHFLRHIISEELRKKNYNIDLWGRAYQPFKPGDRFLTLNDYHFSMAIINGSHLNYFTDTLTDCFRTGTVPILWGCDNVGDFFNEKGIIQFKTPTDLMKILSSLTIQDYYDRMEYIEDNFERVQRYFCTDDKFADELIKHGILNGEPK
jgi:hypothetical protein